MKNNSLLKSIFNLFCFIIFWIMIWMVAVYFGMKAILALLLLANIIVILSLKISIKKRLDLITEKLFDRPGR